MNNFKVGEIVIYKKHNADVYEIGVIKRLTEKGAFVLYHLGDTGALTPYDYLKKIENEHLLKFLIR